ncbi:hypothetical protein [Asticcacaulis sp. YBE204]|uniref:hypothetical protein n=1 Tax=Asticcacaulis sp. YBE204 TaxID=1282363 RepID=UPI0003C4006C|nr:hypothetical protein [Asticcacaulis sp. YBE204]ESQ77956.1 hypothetical protein AEYBE204_15790 [Asticcacaulis sp. YBE204]
MRAGFISLVSIALIGVSGQALADDATLNVMTNRGWTCQGAWYNRAASDNRVYFTFGIWAEPRPDNRLSGDAKMVYKLDGRNYSAMYRSGGFVFDNAEDGTGFYFEDFAITQKDDITSFDMQWIDHLKVSVKAVGKGANMYLEGYVLTRAETYEPLRCVAGS